MFPPFSTEDERRTTALSSFVVRRPSDTHRIIDLKRKECWPMVLRLRSQGVAAFVVIWFGQLISSFGSGLTSFGLGVYLYQATGSATLFALNSFFYVLPLGLVQLAAGALVDRWDRRRVLILSDAGQALLSLLIALLLAANQLAAWHIYLLSALSAVLRAFAGPAYEASVAVLVPKQHLSRAAGMGQINLAFANLVTPALAGFLVLTIGLAAVVWIDLGTFLVAIITLLAVKIPHPQSMSVGNQARSSLLHDMLDGWRYLQERPGLIGMNMLSYLHDFFVNAALVLTVPLVLAFAHADAVGGVLAAGGAGLLVGGALISMWGGPSRLIALYLIAIAFDGLALIVMGGSSNLLVVAIGRFLFFIGFAIYAGMLRALLQRTVPPAIQGRVFGTIGALAMLTEAPAYPVAGFLADWIFEPLMAGGGFVQRTLGSVIGSGPGRGIGLLYIVMGLCLLGVAAAGALSPAIRRLEEIVPDATADGILDS
jgi:MFS transporter, DHA3 family, macrolide efflux protein